MNALVGLSSSEALRLSNAGDRGHAEAKQKKLAQAVLSGFFLALAASEKWVGSGVVKRGRL